MYLNHVSSPTQCLASIIYLPNTVSSANQSLNRPMYLMITVSKPTQSLITSNILTEPGVKLNPLFYQPNFVSEPVSSLIQWLTCLMYYWTQCASNRVSHQSNILTDPSAQLNQTTHQPNVFTKDGVQPIDYLHPRTSCARFSTQSSALNPNVLTEQGCQPNRVTHHQNILF